MWLRASMRFFVGAVILIAAVATPAHTASADVDDFRFSSFDATYTLSRDAAGRSTLDVVETLVAEFPDFDQNRGIRRELVDSFDGHPTDTEIQSVTDADGEPREYAAESDDDILSLTIAGDDFVRGTQTYVITYRQHNVTRFFADTGREEFYWDTNGTGWAQPFDRVTARVVIDADLRSSLTGDFSAFQGTDGSSDSAQITETDEGFLAEATDLAPRENLTFAIGFEPDTFEPRDESFFAAPWPTLSAVGVLLNLAVAVGALILRRRRLRDAPGRGVIVPEYLPPRGVSPLFAAAVAKKPGKAVTAQILQLAVAGNIRVVEIEQKRTPAYRLDFMNSTATDADGLAFLHALFGQTLTPGETRTLAESDSKALSRLGKLTTAVTKRATTDGYFRRIPAGVIAAIVGAAAAATALCFVFAVVSLDSVIGGPIVVAFLIASLLSLGVTIALVARTPLEAKGVELRDHLAGLRMYMTLAEADRMRVLQSPEGALRSPLADVPATAPGSPDTPPVVGQVVLLNERLLPYAALFGLETRWAEELAVAYESAGGHPSWYAGSSGFNPVLFAGAVGSVSTAVTSSYSSSSSGGSGGGGSSGGGGGGGGGGGV